VTLTFDLETGVRYCPWLGNLSSNFGVSRTFTSRLIGQHLLDGLRDLAGLTFDLVGHGMALVVDTGLRTLSVCHISCS